MGIQTLTGIINLGTLTISLANLLFRCTMPFKIFISACLLAVAVVLLMIDSANYYFHVLVVMANDIA